MCSTMTAIQEVIWEQRKIDELTRKFQKKEKKEKTLKSEIFRTENLDKNSGRGINQLQENETYINYSSKGRNLLGMC